MSAKIQIKIECDNNACNNYLELDLSDPSQALIEANKRGWRTQYSKDSVNVYDICPRCAAVLNI